MKHFKESAPYLACSRLALRFRDLSHERENNGDIEKCLGEILT